MKYNEIKAINYRLWLVLLLTSFIPLIYLTTRIHFLGSIPSPSTFSIAAQDARHNLGYEILSEMLLIPLAFILGKVIHSDEAFRSRASISLFVTLTCYLLMTVFVLWLAPNFVDAIQQQTELLSQTIEYIRLESVAILLSSLYAFLSLVLVLKNEQKALYGLLIVQALMTVLCDSFFVSQLPYSLQLGINGIAFSNIAVNSLLALFAIIYLSKSGISLSLKFVTGEQALWLKEWAKIGWKSGFESLVRNTVFIIMILQLINQVQQAGTFWVTNQFIWGWLLLPVLTLGQLIKQDAATNDGLTSERVNSYLWITVGITAIWLMSAPLWNSFIANVMGVEDSVSIINLVWLLVGFYVIFSFNNVIDSYFYGIGRTDLMLYQSLIVNTVFYGSAFVLYQMGIFIPTLERIAIMFGLSITADTIITWILYRTLRNKMSVAQ